MTGAYREHSWRAERLAGHESPVALLSEEANQRQSQRQPKYRDYLIKPILCSMATRHPSPVGRFVPQRLAGRRMGRGRTGLHPNQRWPEGVPNAFYVLPLPLRSGFVGARNLVLDERVIAARQRMSDGTLGTGLGLDYVDVQPL